jgi:ribosome biogenesis GTPase
VLDAVAAGELDEGRLQSYRKLQRELAFLARRQDKAAQAEAARKWKRITVSHRRRARDKP